jgi:DNA polymerase III alpha subunit (gram-positive type)
VVRNASANLRNQEIFMLYRSSGIHDRSVAQTPIPVFDFETTGLHSGYDRVIEVLIIQVDSG